MKILFVCSGNTGRSPMAQFVMQKLIKDAGLSDKISVSSADKIAGGTNTIHDNKASRRLIFKTLPTLSASSLAVKKFSSVGISKSNFSSAVSSEPPASKNDTSAVLSASKS